jgi:hypothetical protein
METIPRIKNIEIQPDYKLVVLFDDNRKVLYNVEEDIDSIESFRPLKDTPGLWPQAQVDKSRTVVSWNDIIDLPSDTLYEYGIVIYQSNDASSDKAAEKSVPYSTVG